MTTFKLHDSESPLPVQPRVSPRSLNGGSRDWEEVSSALLEDGFILTALELHTELLECGREVSTLKDYFSNPGNFEHAIPQPPSGSGHLFRTSSLSTFDSFELGRYSDDSNKETEDKVAVLEFELRKAFETIKSLRGSLTKATEVGPTKEGEVTAKTVTKSSDPIMPHEKRALNFLVHEYLMQRDNKLTAITFTEENGDQDFDDWDDVGLNIPKPPDLLYLFRNYSTCALSDKEKIDRIKQLEDQLSTVTGENLALKRENEALQLRLKRVRYLRRPYL